MDEGVEQKADEYEQKGRTEGSGGGGGSRAVLLSDWSGREEDGGVRLILIPGYRLGCLAIRRGGGAPGQRAPIRSTAGSEAGGAAVSLLIVSWCLSDQPVSRWSVASIQPEPMNL